MASRFPIRRFLKGCAYVTGAGVLFVTYDIARKTRSESHSISTVVQHYFLVKVLKRMGKNVWRNIDNDSRNIRSVQEETLFSQIRENENTAYGRDFSFGQINTVEDFLRLHPLTLNEHYEPYLKRIQSGEDNVLTARKPQILALTSGTSGNPKLMPMVLKQSEVFFKYGIAPCYYFMSTYFPGIDNLQKELKYFYSPKPRSTEGGIPTGPNSSNPQNSKRIWLMYANPPPAYDISTEPEATYAYTLFALKDRNLGILEANFVSLIYSGMQLLERNWKQLVDDIERGQVNPNMNLDPEVRNQLNAMLTPDPVRAEELRKEFSKGFQGIMKRIWPNLNLILAVDSGSFEIYRKLLKKYSQYVPTYSPLYGATEGLLGLNVDPLMEEREYLLIPRAMFYEFIPEDQSDQEQPKTLLMDEVEVGKSYEMVITNMSSQYRYRFGDIVKVSGFHNQCPKVEFLYRKGQFMNLRGEKVSERTFYNAVTAAGATWKNCTLVDYTCTPSALLQATGAKTSSAPHYVVYVEIEGVHNLTAAEKRQIDAKLREKNFAYDSFRQKGSIGDMEVHVVSPGTFGKLKEYAIQRGHGTSNQYKVPRVIVQPIPLQFVCSRMVLDK